MFLSMFCKYDKIIRKDKEYFMRKLLILPIVFASFFADFGAFAANSRGSRGTSGASENNAGTAPVAARAAVRGAAKVTTNNTNAPVAARAATRNAPKSAGNTVSGGVAARAGAKQKVINMGTKVAVATANTVVSQECQDAYFGCMDSFCMLENATGGRCKCSDKNAEYDKTLAAIMEADQQIYVMQTEGVALLKMGKSADEVYAMAEAAAKKVTTDKQEAKKTRTVEMSSFNQSLFDDDDDIFEDDVSGITLDSDLISKTGDNLLASAASICSQKMPAQCADSRAMVRMLYTTKIQSDCTAYENSLTQQQLESNQKLLAARQSLRETALEKYQEANKYDLGGCVREYSACMQQDDTCGEGYTGCVTFAATDNMQNSRSGYRARQYTISGTISGIKLASSTMDQLKAKSVLCESILDQCEKVKSQVWDAFLKSAVATIKTAESDSEDKLRRSCIGEVSECFQTACKEQMDVNNPEGSFDGCLSNPELYKSLCKTKLEPCLLATGGTYDNPDKSSLWTALLARLASMKVDACTKEIRDCLLSEDRCGKDYAGCIGFSTDEIGRICPTDKLTACMKDNNNNEDEVRAYIAKVAQGIALNIENSMLTQCQSALKNAMLTFCGAEDACPNAAVDENMFKDIMSVQLCKKEGNKYVDCSTDVYSFKSQDLIDAMVTPMLVNKIDLSSITYNQDYGTETPDNTKCTDPFCKEESSEGGDDRYGSQLFSSTELGRVIRTLNNNYKTILNSVESDPKVVYCKTGRKVEGFSKLVGDKFEGYTIGSGTQARFPSLTNNVRAIIAQQLLVATSPVYFETQQEVLDEQMSPMKKSLLDRIEEIVATAQEKQKAINAVTCMSIPTVNEGFPSRYWYDQSHWKSEVEYDEENNTCTKRGLHWKRNGTGIAYDWLRDEGADVSKTVNMPTIDRNDLQSDDDDNNAAAGIKGALTNAQEEAEKAIKPLEDLEISN